MGVEWEKIFLEFVALKASESALLAGRTNITFIIDLQSEKGYISSLYSL